MCRHIYDWNIVNCDVKQTIQLNLYTSDERHAWFHWYGISWPVKCASKATNYKIKHSCPQWDSNPQPWDLLSYHLLTELRGLCWKPIHLNGLLLYFTFLSHLFPLPCGAGSTVPREGIDSSVIMPFPGVLWLWHFLYSVGPHPVKAPREGPGVKSRMCTSVSPAWS